MTIEDIKLILKAFYKVNDIERKAHGEQGAYEYSQTMEYYDDILMHYYDLKGKSSSPSDLNEAAEDFVWEVMENDEDGISELSKKLRPTSKINDFYDALGEFFKAGAEWMAGQGASFKVNVEEVPQGHWYSGLHLGGCSEEEENALKSINAKDGEEVIVQIRKKQ